MKKDRKIIIISAAILLVLVAASLLLVKFTSAKTETGVKTVTVTVAHKDGTQKELEITTDREYLGEALFDEKIVTKEEFTTGFYTVIDGEKADYNADGGWWNVAVDGKSSMVGINEIALKDGQKIELVYTYAYEE